VSAFRWFADESVLGLGKLLARERDDVLFPGHPALPEVPLGAPDVDWMRIVAERDLVAFHRDRHVRTRPHEVARYREYGLRSVWFGGKKDLSAGQQLSLLLRHWAELEARLATLHQGPWSLTLTVHGLDDLPWRPKAR
jgi:hypothetical protein